MSKTDQHVVRWYTRARRFPQLIGRTPDGTRIPGGPYTVTQVATAGALMFIGVKTTSLWAHYGLIGNGLILAAVVYAVVYLLGKIPFGSRNPLAIGAGIWRAVSAPSTGRIGGRPIRLRRPHRVQHCITVLLSPPSPTQPAPAAVEPVVVAEPVRVAEPVAALDGTAARAPRGNGGGVTRVLHPHRALGQRRGLGRHRRHDTDPVPTAGPLSAVLGSSPNPPATTPTAAAPALSGVQALLAQNATSTTSLMTSRRS